MKLWVQEHHGITATVIVVVLLAGILYAGACEYFYRVAFIPSEKSFLNTKLSASEKAARTWLKQVPHQVWHQAAADHTSWQLAAWYVPAAKPTKKTIVVAHGYMNTHENMAEYVRMFHSAGYNVLAPDDRGHGASDGDYVGYGWADRADYQQWIRRVLKANGTDSRIGLFGVSMGGATVMYLAGMKLPAQVKTVVEDCGYTSVDAELAYQAKSMYNLPRWPLVPGVLALAHLHTGIKFTGADTRPGLKRNTLPTLFIHGAADKFVPTVMGKQNYAASAGPKELWIVPDAGHATSYHKHPRAYEQHVLTFMRKHL